MFRILKIIFFIVLVFTLPFIILIRISVFVHTEYQFYPYACTLIGIGATTFLIFIYFSIVNASLTGKFGSFTGLKVRAVVALIFVFGYAIHGLVFLSSANVKQDKIKTEFQELHPIFRLGISTLTHIDKKLILTDAERKPEDYRRMGLKTNKNSLHYRQKDGYVYAVDIRTNGRGEVANFLVRSYFRLMGFKTLRHVGTDDHLHVSLYNHDRPWAQ